VSACCAPGGEFIDASLPVEAQAGALRVFGYAGSPQARAEAQYFLRQQAAACRTGCWRNAAREATRRCCTASASPVYLLFLEKIRKRTSSFADAPFDVDAARSISRNSR